jgi:hypothetical protein
VLAQRPRYQREDPQEHQVYHSTFSSSHIRVLPRVVHTGAPTIELLHLPKRQMRVMAHSHLLRFPVLAHASSPDLSQSSSSTSPTWPLGLPCACAAPIPAGNCARIGATGVAGLDVLLGVLVPDRCMTAALLESVVAGAALELPHPDALLVPLPQVPEPVALPVEGGAPPLRFAKPPSDLPDGGGAVTPDKSGFGIFVSTLRRIRTLRFGSWSTSSRPSLYASARDMTNVRFAMGTAESAVRDGHRGSAFYSLCGKIMVCRLLAKKSRSVASTVLTKA